MSFVRTADTNDVRAPLYFVNGWVDFILVGGASIVLLGLFKLFSSGIRTDVLISTGAALVWVCNWPHFAATGYRLYGSKAVMRKHPFSTFVFPLFILAGTAAWMASPDGFAPYYIKFFLIWSGFHYAGQNAVVSQIYARRANLEVRPWEQSVVFLLSYAAVFSPSALAEVDAQGENYYYGQAYPNLGVPIQIAQASEIAVWILTAVFAVVVVLWCLRLKRLVPVIVVLPVAAHLTWFVLAGNQEGYREFVPFFHCAQYLLLAWGGELQSKLEAHSIPPSRRYLALASLRWYGINVVIGAFLFWVLPRGLEKVGVNWNVANGAVVGAIMMMHFYLDAILWRVGDPKVGRSLVHANAARLAGVPAPVPVAMSNP